MPMPSNQHLNTLDRGTHSFFFQGLNLGQGNMDIVFAVLPWEMVRRFSKINLVQNIKSGIKSLKQRYAHIHKNKKKHAQRT